MSQNGLPPGHALLCPALCFSILLPIASELFQLSREWPSFWGKHSWTLHAVMPPQVASWTPGVSDALFTPWLLRNNFGHGWWYTWPISSSEAASAHDSLGLQRVLDPCLGHIYKPAPWYCSGLARTYYLWDSSHLSSLVIISQQMKNLQEGQTYSHTPIYTHTYSQTPRLPKPHFLRKPD